MPQVTLYIIDEDEIPAVQDAMRIVSEAIAHDDARMIRPEGPDDKPAFYPSFDARYRSHIEPAIDAVNERIDAGEITVNLRPNHRPTLELATKTVSHHYPVAFMDDAQTEAFDQALSDVNAARRNGHCHFDTFLDDTARVIFRYGVQDDAPDRARIHEAIHTVIDAVHSGQAVYIEMPSGGVMITPRLF